MCQCSVRSFPKCRPRYRPPSTRHHAAKRPWIDPGHHQPRPGIATPDEPRTSPHVVPELTGFRRRRTTATVNRLRPPHRQRATATEHVRQYQRDLAEVRAAARLRVAATIGVGVNPR
uniref:(northern house mosquito) hypothetical protein n=1 Tax=Culex pipiens TaxID=7175 RepID=A0A8D8G0X8_CULPI